MTIRSVRALSCIPNDICDADVRSNVRVKHNVRKIDVRNQCATRAFHSISFFSPFSRPVLFDTWLYLYSAASMRRFSVLQILLFFTQTRIETERTRNNRHYGMRALIFIAELPVSFLRQFDRIYPWLEFGTTQSMTFDAFSIETKHDKFRKSYLNYCRRSAPSTASTNPIAMIDFTRLSVESQRLSCATKNTHANR